MSKEIAAQMSNMDALMDFKLRCRGCGHEVMLPRKKAEKNIKKIIPAEELRAD